LIFKKTKSFKWSALGLILLLLTLSGCAEKGEEALRFEISFPDSVHSDSITGRVYVIVS
jgi:outer membrane lipoprotein-sorting protein